MKLERAALQLEFMEFGGTLPGMSRAPSLITKCDNAQNQKKRADAIKRHKERRERLRDLACYESFDGQAHG